MFKSIVVGLDGSPASETALRTACDIAKHYASDVHLVHTPEPQTAGFATGAVAGYHAIATMPSEDEVRAAAGKIIQDGRDIAKDCGQSIAGTHVQRGNPVDEIIGYADGCGADLIVTGRRGLGNISSLILGSTSQRISHAAKCAVLTVV